MRPDWQSLLDRAQEIDHHLTDPAVLADQKKSTALLKEQKHYRSIIVLLTELAALERGLAEAEEATTSDDAELAELGEEQLIDLTNQRDRLEATIQETLARLNPMNSKNAIVEIRAGAGGDEAGLFAADLFRMYSRFCEQRDWRATLLSSNRTGIGGFKEVIFEVIGDGAYGDLKYESGVHRVQRVPETEKNGRVHTSTVTVVVLPEAEEVDFEIQANDLRIDVFRAGGHGGQSVNTTDSAVRVTHLPTGMVVTCQDEKSQHQNKAKALQILRSRLLAAEQEKRDAENRATRQSQIGKGMRAEKIRTYNFPQDRVTDHRIKESWNTLALILDGQIEPLIAAIKAADEVHLRQGYGEQAYHTS